MTPFSKEQKTEIVSSIQRYFTADLDLDLSEMQAGFLLEYFMNEIAPYAYNKGVEDAQEYFIRMTEDLPNTCFQEPMGHWKTSKAAGRTVRRKPD